MYNDQSNGFQSIIIPMSANHQSIMHSILAVAAFYRRRDVVAYEVVSLTQKENALVHIRSKVFADSVDDYDESIVLAIMLCVFEVKDGSGPDWAKHLYGGRSILQSKVQQQGSQMWADGLSWWANKFFGYLAVNSATGNESPALMERPEFWLSQGFEVEVSYPFTTDIL
jgi:Fungal specific transcription factor domain